MHRSDLIYRFFDAVTRPLMERLGATTVVEIGSDQGHQTALVAQWCLDHDAVLHVVDPLPKYDVEEWAARWPGAVEFHLELSLDALPELGACDVALIDGDHNWYTVHHELLALEDQCRRAGARFPLVLLHDVGWPYGRRDLYYDPDTIPAEHRHPYRKGGLDPDERELQESGFNDHLYNALHEGTPRNGVLTAVEDFVQDRDGFTFHRFPGVHGLGILADDDTCAQLGDVWDDLVGVAGHRRVLEVTEADRIKVLLDNWTRQRDARRLRQQAADAKEVAEERMETVERLRGDKTRLQEDLVEVRQELKATVERLEAERAKSHAAQEDLQDLRERLQRSEQRFHRLRNRRSVRAVLRLASLARPLFRLRRGQPSLGTSRSSGGADGRVRRQVRMEASLDGTAFGAWAARALEVGSSEFVTQWHESQAALDLEVPAVSGQPLVSVIMPTWNRAAQLRTAILAVLEQDWDNWELLVCDDASQDDTAKVVAEFDDDRIRYLPSETRHGAAAARNRGLEVARGAYVAYLDSDNLWHPSFLAAHLTRLMARPGNLVSYSKYIDVVMNGDDLRVKDHRRLPFDYDDLARKNFVDLNSVVHRREMFDILGGFEESLVRRQDWHLVLKYAFLRDPLYLDRFLAVYRRNRDWEQLTDLHRGEQETQVAINRAVSSYYREGLPRRDDVDVPSVTVVSWDICRNHFSKAYNLAEAMGRRNTVQLLGFRFFDEPIFPPYADSDPLFSTTYLEGGEFPDFAGPMARAVASVRGDVVYAVKPRLPSLGVALLRNYHDGTPIVVEMNDLESVVTNPEAGARPSFLRIEDVDPADPDLRNPYGQTWTRLMEGLTSRVPLRATHNRNLDQTFGGGAFLVRNLKDDRHYSPHLYDRGRVREELGYEPEDRVLLFGGMVRRHKGVFEMVEALERVGDRHRLLVVGSRETPDQQRLREVAGDRVTILDPVDRNRMAAINLAADAVVLWLDPEVPASHYQMPYKLTDALAMRVPVIANDIGDLGTLGRSGHLLLAPFGDVEALSARLQQLEDDSAAAREMVERGRRLYLRQFSYLAAERNLELISQRAMADAGTLPVAEEFAAFFDRFMTVVTRSS